MSVIDPKLTHDPLCPFREDAERYRATLFTDIPVSKKEHDQVVYDRDFFEAERDACRLALTAVRADLADRDRTIYELNCTVQEVKRERDDVRKAKGFTERERDAALDMVAQRDRRIADLEAALRGAQAWLNASCDDIAAQRVPTPHRLVDAALSPAPEQPATATKDLFGPADDVIAAQGLLNAALPAPAATKVVTKYERQWNDAVPLKDGDE